MEMEDDDDGFFNIDVLLAEEGLLQPSNTETEAEPSEKVSRAQLTVGKKRFIIDSLLHMVKDNKLPRGFQKKLADEMGVHKCTISRIFHEILTQTQVGHGIDVRSKKAGRVGRKPYEYSEEFLQSTPLHLRTTLRSFAGHLKVSHASVHRLKKRGLLRSHTSNNHPSVSREHKITRMRWVLGQIIPGTVNSNPIINDMHNVIHIDEKWFYLNPEMRRFYLLPAEDDPYRCTQSKRYKIKAMFMGVISRPIYDGEGKLVFDGKFGIFPFVYKKRAQKSSKNRKAGTLETKAEQNITKEVIRDMLINKVFPAINAKWPPNLSKNILVQWDNARPHKIPNDQEFITAATKDGFDMKMVFQPPQSPDLNVLDLGLFRSIQSLQYQTFPKDLEELVVKVEEAYDAFDPHVNKFCWLTLQWIMVEILKCKGGNNYKIPHNNKAAMERMGTLPANVEVPQQVVDDAVQYLNEIIVVPPQRTNDFDNEVGVDAD